MNRIRVALALGAMLFGSVACAGSSSGSNTVTVFIRKVSAQTSAQKQYFDDLAAQFHKAHPKYSVKFQFWSTADEESTKIETSAASHSGPDIFALGSAVMPTAYATGAFRMFTAADWNQVGGQKQFLPRQLTLAGPSPDKYFGVPDRNTAFGILYNKSMFAAAGITSPPKTWTEFVADAQKLTNPSKGVYGLTIDPSDGFDPWHMVWLLSRQAGSELVTPDGKTGLLNSPIVEQQAGFWLDLITKHKVAERRDATNKFADSLAQFVNGKAAMFMPVGTSAVARLNASAMKDNYAIMQFPTVPYGQSARPPNGIPTQSWLSDEYYTVFKYSKHPDMALAMIKLLISDQSQSQIFKNEGFLPSTVSAAKSIPGIADPPYDVLTKSVEQSYPTPFVEGWATLETAVAKALNQVAQQIAVKGSYTPAELHQALTQANESLNTALAKGGS